TRSGCSFIDTSRSEEPRILRLVLCRKNCLARSGRAEGNIRQSERFGQTTSERRLHARQHALRGRLPERHEPRRRAHLRFAPRVAEGERRGSHREPEGARPQRERRRKRAARAPTKRAGTRLTQTLEQPIEGGRELPIFLAQLPRAA